jgi:Ca-activated chloride channel homolog
MLQDDIPPSRIGAAKEAALSFIQRQKDTNLIGIVAFASFAQLVQPPSSDVEELETAITLLTTGRGTAIGSGILTGLDAIAEFSQSGATPVASAVSATPVAPREKGDYEPDIIVLLTDGVATTGPPPLKAAQLAADRGIRIYTIGYGTETGSTNPGSDYFGGGWGFRRRGIDEETLKQIAEMTGGQYYAANSAGELQKVFDRLPTFLITRKETIEISVLFAALGALLIASAVLLVQLWRPLP